MSPTIRHLGQRNQPGGAASPFSRDGFTLVEMLVVITVILILMGVSLAVMNVSLEGERVRSGARQIQSYLAGARDRAAYSNRPCGVRFICNRLPGDNTVVQSMVYIELPADWKQGSSFAWNYGVTPGEDVNNNGQLDANEDTNGNGLLDPVIPKHSLLFAENAVNGRFDTEDLNGDTFLNRGNGNGVLDTGEDVNNNNVLDTGEDRWEDADNDGFLDFETDQNGNGRCDSHEDRDTSTTEWHLVLVAGEDRNGNGVLDPGEDVNNNNVLDTAWVNKPKIQIAGNWHTVDAFFWHKEDVNSDGFLNRGNENGVLDTEDTNRNGQLDLGEDLNGNGVLDYIEDINRNGTLDFGEDTWEDKNFNGKLDIPQVLRIIPPYTGSHRSRIPQNGYRLQLQPVIMAGQEPVLFPSGVVIDLDQCRAAHREDANNNGVLDSGEDLDQDGQLDPGTNLALPNSWFAASGGYNQSLDILFSPNGTVFGSAAARGIVHLVVNDEVDSTQNLFPVDLPGTTTPNLSDKRVVSLFTRTGTATTSELTPWTIYRDLGLDYSVTPPVPTNNHNQFYYAERGKSE